MATEFEKGVNTNVWGSFDGKLAAMRSAVLETSIVRNLGKPWGLFRKCWRCGWKRSAPLGIEIEI